MKPKKKTEITAYRGHAIERLDQEYDTMVPEEHGTNSVYECGVSILEEKESV